MDKLPASLDASAPRPQPRTSTQRFVLLHGVLIPGAFALAAVLSSNSGFDQALSARFFDPLRGEFPARASALLELLGHRLAKSAVLLTWVAVVLAALGAQLRVALTSARALLWTTAGAMALGPVIVVILKELNSHQCPWNLRAFGGPAEFANAWFVPAAEVGRCFPAGHAAGGFCLVALSFAFSALDRRRLSALWLAATIVAGLTFSGVRLAQGAHFLSHSLWSAAIDWMAAALVFAWVLSRREERARPLPHPA